MGWWSSIVDGVSNAAGWVIDNASTIGTVVSTVAKVAGYLALAEEAEDEAQLLNADEPFDMPKFIYTMGKAEKNLKDAATAKSNEVFKSQGNTGSRTVINNQVYSGLWAKPVIADSLFGIPGQEMTSDLSHMLSMNEFPQTISTKAGNVDVAAKLGEAIFAGPPIDPLAFDPSLGSTPFSVVTAQLDSADGSQAVVCTHAYYAIPSGGEGNETSWHAAINLTTSQTPDSLKSYREERIRLATVPAAVGFQLDDAASIANIWQVTLNILWTAAHYATKAAPLVANYILASNVILEIQYNNTDGLTTFLQIKAKPGVTPFQARAAVVTATNSAIKEIGAQKLAVVTQGTAFKPEELGITEVDIIANHLIEYNVPVAQKKTVSGTNRFTNGTKQVPKKLTAGRRFVSFKPLPDEFGNDFDGNTFDADGAQFYLPVLLRQKA